MTIAHQLIGGGGFDKRSAVEIVVNSPIPQSLVIDNVNASFARQTPRLADIPGLGTSTGPVALIGGGPSLKDELNNLRRFRGTTIGCGSVHDFLIDEGVIPDYHAICDPDPVMATLITDPVRGVCYLVASQCHPDMFAALDGCDIRLWHAMVIARDTGESIVDFRGEPVIPGGDYVILRAWPIAAAMGHREFHFFGFDCSFPPGCESQHAYAYGHDREAPIGAEVQSTGERFITTPGWVVQLDAFVGMLPLFAGEFSVTIHGKSLAASTFAARFGRTG